MARPGRGGGARRRGLALAAGLLAALTVAAPARAEDAAPDPHAVMPERPTVATHAHTVAPGWVELEFGLERDLLDGGGRALSLPVFTKVGLGSHVQLGLSTPRTSLASTAPAGSGPGDCALAVKWRLLDHARVLGDFAVQPTVKIPTGDLTRGTGTGTTDGSLLLISSHEFGPLALDVNLGYTRRGGDGSVAPLSATLWTVSAGYPLFRALGAVTEVFGLPGTRGETGGPPTVGLLLGPTFQPRPWLELDAGVIVPMAGPQAHGVYCGGVWNVGRM